MQAAEKLKSYEYKESFLSDQDGITPFHLASSLPTSQCLLFLLKSRLPWFSSCINAVDNKKVMTTSKPIICTFYCSHTTFILLVLLEECSFGGVLAAV